MSTREDHINFMLGLGLGWTPATLDGFSDGDLAWSYENHQRRDGGLAAPRRAGAVSRVDGRDDDLDRRVNEEVARRLDARRQDADPELAAAMTHFDKMPDLLEAYHRADAWLHGEAAAWAAAELHVFGAGRSGGARRVTDAGSDSLEDEMRRFDEVMANGGAPTSGEPLRSKASVQAQSAQSGISAFKDTAAYAALSDAERAAADAVIADAEARLAAITGGDS